jgi:glycosyltransferase involved in cell wall biosynthesis
LRNVARAARLVRRIRWLRRLLREFRPDVVHGHVVTGDPFFAALARARPLVVTAWGSDVLLASRGGRLRGRLVARRADLLTADSESLLEAVAALGGPRNRLMLLNWGVDLEAFSPGRAEARRRLGLPDVPIVLSPRALLPVYNPATILDAFSHVLREIPNALLVVKHYGDALAELAEHPAAERIRVVGRVPLEELPDYYRAADVCVSIASSDSSPRSVWEAMACGCPCVVSDLPWAHELIEPGRDALLVPIDAAAVASAVAAVLTDPALASGLARNGRALVERHHDRAVEADRLVAAYERLAAGRDGGFPA